jgi:hypothetical protein
MRKITLQMYAFNQNRSQISETDQHKTLQSVIKREIMLVTNNSNYSSVQLS